MLAAFELHLETLIWCYINWSLKEVVFWSNLFQEKHGCVHLGLLFTIHFSLLRATFPLENWQSFLAMHSGRTDSPPSPEVDFDRCVLISEAHLLASMVGLEMVTWPSLSQWDARSHMPSFGEWSFPTFLGELVRAKFFLSLLVSKHADLEHLATGLYPSYHSKMVTKRSKAERRNLQKTDLWS